MWCSFNHSFNHYPLMFNNTFLANTRNKSLSKWLHTDWLNRTIYQCLVGSWCYNILILCMILGSAQSKLASSRQICRFQRKVRFLLPPTLVVLPTTAKHLDCAVGYIVHYNLTCPVIKFITWSATDLELSLNDNSWSKLHEFELAGVVMLPIITAGNETNPNSKKKITKFRNINHLRKTKNDSTPFPKRPAKNVKTTCFCYQIVTSQGLFQIQWPWHLFKS